MLSRKRFPARYITYLDNIVKYMESSKRVLFLVSEAFVNSYWCMEEFEFAYRSSRMKRLVVLLIEDIATENCGETMGAYMKKRTYINVKHGNWLDQLMYMMPIHRLGYDISSDTISCGDTDIFENTCVPLICLAAKLFLREIKSRIFTKYQNISKYHSFDEDECEGEDMQYDVYLAYSDERPLDFTVDLVRGLEANHYKVCVHERDFIPGSMIQDNIVTAIDT